MLGTARCTAPEARGSPRSSSTPSSHSTTPSFTHTGAQQPDLNGKARSPREDGRGPARDTGASISSDFFRFVNISNQQPPASRFQTSKATGQSHVDPNFMMSEEEQAAVFVNGSNPADRFAPQPAQNGQQRGIKDQIINLMNGRQQLPRQSAGRDSELPNDSRHYQLPEDYSGWSQIENKVVNGDQYDFAASHRFPNEPEYMNYDISRFGEPASFMNKPIFPGDSQISADPVDHLQKDWNVVPAPHQMASENQKTAPSGVAGQTGSSQPTAFNQHFYQPSSFSPNHRYQY